MTSDFLPFQLVPVVAGSLARVDPGLCERGQSSITRQEEGKDILTETILSKYLGVPMLSN